MKNNKLSYEYNGPAKEPLILEPEDWTESEWATILKLFGMESAERIKVSDYVLESYGIKKKIAERSVQDG